MKTAVKTCPNGHTFKKSSDCPTCPICENERKPKEGFLTRLGAPARRALERENIHSLNDLTRYSIEEILDLHGVGKTTIPLLQKMLSENGLSFRGSDSVHQ